MNNNNNDNRGCHTCCKPKSGKDEASLAKQTKKPSSEIGKYLNDKNTKNNSGDLTEQKKK